MCTVTKCIAIANGTFYYKNILLVLLLYNWTKYPRMYLKIPQQLKYNLFWVTITSTPSSSFKVLALWKIAVKS